MTGVCVKRSLTSSIRALMGHLPITMMAVIKRRKRQKRFFPLRERTVPSVTSNRIDFTVDVRFVETGKRKTNIDAYNFYTRRV